MASSIHDPLGMDLSAATAGLLDFLDTQIDNTRSLDRILSSTQRQALEVFVDASQTLSRAKTTQALNLISQLLKNEHLSIKIVELYRPLVLDLVARWLVPEYAALSPLNDQEYAHRSLPQDLEDMARAFALILPIVPQVKR